MNAPIVVRISDGLGNQMFQYALGRHISIINEAPLKLDISRCGAKNSRSYKLKFFNISAEICVKSRFSRVKARVKRITENRLYPPRVQKTVKQDKLRGNPDVLETEAGAYIRGWWQSERYFKAIENIIRNDFTVKNAPDENNLRTLRNIEAVNSVALHVRRTDYIDSPLHHLLGMDYYERAIALMSLRVENPEFFIFSDDINWCRLNFKIPFPSNFMDYNGSENDYEDLRLMSRCKNAIIANSTFSWWGAWLNDNPYKIVIAPFKWMTVPEDEREDIIPEGWIKL